MSSATDKLADTRRAMVLLLHGTERAGGSGPPIQERSVAGSSAGKGASGPRGWLGKLERAGSIWWRRHPACAGVALAKPVLASYATQKPGRFLGIAVAAGAVIVVMRGWGLVSIGGVLAALVKSSPPSSLALAAMSAIASVEEGAEPAAD